MAIIKKDKLKQMKNEEITTKINEIRLEIAKELSNSKVGGQAKNPGNIRNMRRTVARLMTLKNQKGVKK